MVPGIDGSTEHLPASSKVIMKCLAFTNHLPHNVVCMKAFALIGALHVPEKLRRLPGRLLLILGHFFQPPSLEAFAHCNAILLTFDGAGPSLGPTNLVHYENSVATLCALSTWQMEAPSKVENSAFSSRMMGSVVRPEDLYIIHSGRRKVGGLGKTGQTGPKWAKPRVPRKPKFGSTAPSLLHCAVYFARPSDGC